MGEFNALLTGVPQIVPSALNYHRVNEACGLYYCRSAKMAEKTAVMMVDGYSVFIPPFQVGLPGLQGLIKPNSLFLKLP